MAGIIEDGFPTIIDLPGAGLTFYEKTIKPPGIDGGGENDVTTMRNTAVRTRVPKKLKTMTDIKVTVLYDDAIFDDAAIYAEVNVNQLITITFPSGGTVAVWGWINTWEPADISEGEPPTGDINIMISNRNALGAETAPVYTAPGP